MKLAYRYAFREGKDERAGKLKIFLSLLVLCTLSHHSSITYEPTYATYVLADCVAAPEIHCGIIFQIATATQNILQIANEIRPRTAAEVKDDMK